MLTNKFRLKINILAASLLASATLLPQSVNADTVVLKSADGRVDLQGAFVEFAQGHYVVKTALGSLRVSAARVTCTGEACPTLNTEGADLKFAGSHAIGNGLMPLLLSGYAAGTDATVSIAQAPQGQQMLAEIVGDNGYGDDLGSYLVTPTSSDDAFRALLRGDAHIGMASRRITPSEARALKAADAGNMISPDQEHILAVDSIVIITNPSNKITEISFDQLREIYAGNITNWSELGGEDMQIQVVNRAQDTDARTAFETSISGDATLLSNAPEMIADSNNEMAAMVNQNPAAIGFVPYAFQRGAKPLNLVAACGIVHTPDAFSAKTEEYPLKRRLYLYNRADVDNEKARDFLNYALSDEADAAITKAGFITLGTTRRSQGMDAKRAKAFIDMTADAFEANAMSEMLEQMASTDRLSTTFRFRSGSSRLDERGAIDMARLVDYLKVQPRGTKITLVGFTDDVGVFQSNRALSDKRAKRVANTLRNEGGADIEHIQISTVGYGEMAPATCNTSKPGQSINRRVEVWIESEVQG